MNRFGDFFGKYELEFFYESDWINSDDPQVFIETYLLENRERDILT